MLEQVILSGNCSWTLEAVFQHIKGMKSVKAGTYSLKPYEFKFNEKDKLDAVFLEFDNSIINLEQVLDIFYSVHNPNINSWIIEECFSFKHRSSIIIKREQKEIAEFKVKEISDSKIFGDSTPNGGNVNTKVITYIDDDLFEFLKGSEKEFYLTKPKDPYTVSMIVPKVEKIKDKFPQFYQVVEFKEINNDK